MLYYFEQQQATIQVHLQQNKHGMVHLNLCSLQLLDTKMMLKMMESLKSLQLFATKKSFKKSMKTF